MVLLKVIQKHQLKRSEVDIELEEDSEKRKSELKAK